eukprot:Cvel_29671.t1-p1 / transcript=Cvel_29671.t1 / gene=Cvel_29671 / organism=Chromera_velia_CCMP2878 / gene_product=Ribosomal large subunit pseudouridine synthase A, putative / transcript_product=Ribosomal large subunit pseudouridine synthase A, putative / location=Cvel_scaffold4101:9297-10605(+) / protein_length=172 / sequence_SO=supercontig / SO=protein_coding / is_pseudo=false
MSSQFLIDNTGPKGVSPKSSVSWRGLVVFLALKSPFPHEVKNARTETAFVNLSRLRKLRQGSSAPRRRRSTSPVRLFKIRPEAPENGKWAGDVKEIYARRWMVGEADRLAFGEEDLEVLFADEHIVVCNKPSGLLSVPGRDIRDSVAVRAAVRFGVPSLENMICHRLDQLTS